MPPIIYVPGQNDRIEPYSDATYDYFCFGPPDKAVGDAVHRIKRVRKADSQVTYPGGDSDYRFTATDLATVQGHFA